MTKQEIRMNPEMTQKKELVHDLKTAIITLLKIGNGELASNKY